MSKKTFRLNPDPTFQATVKFPIAGEQTASFKAEFKHRNSEEIKDLIARLADMEDLDLMQDIMVGWDIGEPFNEENLQKLISNYGAAARTIADTYWREIYGAREGN